ncbi:MAG: energy transducer TonB [Sphingobacteriales bacterium 41-5]|nr:MAG: energy transducer TonB [Sphingobacteriales bacterium 41-5]
MEANKILSSDFLDILFEGRNKEYGAYELRRSYNRRMWRALIFVALLLAAIGAAVLLNKQLKPKQTAEDIKMQEVTIQEIQQEEKKDEAPPPPPPPPKQEPPPKVEMKAFTPPKIVKDEEVREPPPAVEELKETKIGTINQEGVKDIGIAAPPVVVDAGKGIVAEVKKPEPEPEIFTKVEIDAAYPGGASAWRSFLERNLRGETPVDNGASPGNYTVIIQFVVDVAGNVSDVKPLTSLGYGMEQEAVRVLKKSGRWKPAIQNGREVKAYRKQPITFQVLEN